MITPMKHFAVVLLFMFMILYGSDLRSEEMSKEQMEIWKLENVYWESIKTGNIKQFLELLHDNTSPWPESKKIPMNKEQTGMMIKQWVKYETINFLELEPKVIQVYENAAIVFYSYKYSSNKGTNSGKITHTWVNQNGKWKMIGGMNSPYFSWPETATKEKASDANTKDYSSIFVVEGKYKNIPIKGSNNFVFDWKSRGDNRDSKPKGPLDNVNRNCSGLIIFLNGIGYGKGHCVYTTTEGDMLLSEFKIENAKIGDRNRKRTLEFIAGTGRLAGIEGEAELKITPVFNEAKDTFKYIVEILYPYKSP